MAAAQRGIWKASELQSLLSEYGLSISAGKMSGLWSGQPVMVRLDDLEVICTALQCQITDLLAPEPGSVVRVAEPVLAKAVGLEPAPVTPRRRDGRSLPPR
jgi:DNA-binding Xre family transcriptional regulator